MKKIIAALNTTLDGYIEGPQGEIDWVESWEDEEDATPQFDTCLLGAGMYPGYEQYWTAVRSAPDKPLPFSGALTTAGEQAYAQFAYTTPHIVLSTHMQSAAWPHTQIVRSTKDIAKLKQRKSDLCGGRCSFGRHTHQRWFARRDTYADAPHLARWRQTLVQRCTGAASPEPAKHAHVCQWHGKSALFSAE